MLVAVVAAADHHAALTTSCQELLVEVLSPLSWHQERGPRCRFGLAADDNHGALARASRARDLDRFASFRDDLQRSRNEVSTT